MTDPSSKTEEAVARMWEYANRGGDGWQDIKTALRAFTEKTAELTATKLALEEAKLKLSEQTEWMSSNLVMDEGEREKLLTEGFRQVDQLRQWANERADKAEAEFAALQARLTPLEESGRGMRDIHAEFDRLLTQLDTKTWTAGDRGNFFAFFCHGWYGRVGEAEFQRATAERKEGP